jgi:hypothetical protein
MSKHNWTKEDLVEILAGRAYRKQVKAQRKARGREKKRLRQTGFEYDIQSGFTNLPPHGWKFLSQPTK